MYKEAYETYQSWLEAIDYDGALEYLRDPYYFIGPRVKAEQQSMDFTYRARDRWINKRGYWLEKWESEIAEIPSEYKLKRTLQKKQPYSRR